MYHTYSLNMLQKKHLVIVMLVLYIYSVNCEKEKLYIECDPTKESAEKSTTACPKNAKCVELGKTDDKVTTAGLCACMTNFTVNKDYSPKVNNSIYCVENQNQTLTTQAPPVPSTTVIVTTIKTKVTSTQQPSTAPPVPSKITTTLAPQPKAETTTKKVEITTPKPSVESQTKATSDNNDKEHDIQQQNKENQTNHILGGIIVPIMIVFAFIGVVYGIRKYDMLERAQNFIRNRRTGGQTHQTRYDGLENDFDDDPLLI